MDKASIGILVVLGALCLFGVLRALADFAHAVGLQRERTRIGLEGVGYAIGQPMGVLAATIEDHRLMSVGLAITLFVAVLFLAGADSASVVSSVDALGGQGFPLLGWMICGGIAGIAMAVGSRVLELGWFGAAAIARVPDINHLRAGEEVAARYFRIRSFAALVGTVILLSTLAFSYSRNAGYDRDANFDRKATAIAAAGTAGKIAVLNRALEDSAGRLRSDPKTGLPLLAALQGLSKDGARPEVERVAKIAQKYLAVYREETEKLVTDGKPEALARSEAFSEVDKVGSLKWLGRLYEAGKGGANRDLSKAFSHYGEAALAGDKAATNMRDKLVQLMVQTKDDTTRQAVFSYLDSKAQGGSPSDHYWLGEWYARSSKSEDQKSAEKWLGQALAQSVDATAKNKAFLSLSKRTELGTSSMRVLDDLAPKYAKGKDEGMKRVAYAYLEQRANAGDPGSAVWMGFRFSQGDGVAKDHEKAGKWFLKAAFKYKGTAIDDRTFAELGEDVGAALTRVLDEQAPKYVKGKDESVRSAAYAYLEKRANAGDPGAQLWIGFRYTEGDGVPKDEAKAHNWFLKAALQNKNKAAKNKAFDVLGERYHPPIPNPKVVPLGPAQGGLSNRDTGWDPLAGAKVAPPILPLEPTPAPVAREKRLVIPPNATLNYAGDGWMCGRGYRQVGNECIAVVMPANATLNYAGDGWMCGRGYRQVGNECKAVVMPANATLNYAGDGWMCGRGYRQVGNECIALVTSTQ